MIKIHQAINHFQCNLQIHLPSDETDLVDPSNLNNNNNKREGSKYLIIIMYPFHRPVDTKSENLSQNLSMLKGLLAVSRYLMNISNGGNQCR